MRFKPSLILYTQNGERYLTRWAPIPRVKAFAKLPLMLRYLCDWRPLLHRLHGPDPDRSVHDHPWFAVCVVLRGSYWQIRRTADGREHLEHVRRWNVLRLNEYHRIIIVSPNTWTLCLAGPRFRRWGFLVNGVHEDMPDVEEQA